MALAKDEPRAALLLGAQADRVAVVSSLAWAEVASLAQRGRVRMDKADAIAQAARTEPVLHEDCVVGGRLHGRLRRDGHRKVGLADCIIYASARRLGIGLLTLDSDLEGLPGVEALGKKA